MFLKKIILSLHLSASCHLIFYSSCFAKHLISWNIAFQTISKLRANENVLVFPSLIFEKVFPIVFLFTSF